MGAAVAAGFDLAGFQIAMEPTLAVAYGQTAAMDGMEVEKAATAQHPIMAVPSGSHTAATSLAILMVDLDIPSSTQPTTYLHWIQTGLTMATEVSTMVTNHGEMQGHAISMATNTSAIVPYTPPNPPAQNPYSHRYAQILLDTSMMTHATNVILQTAAEHRVHFDIATILQQTGLAEHIMAWNHFNVTNHEGAAEANNHVATNSTPDSGKGGKTEDKETVVAPLAASNHTATPPKGFAAISTPTYSTGNITGAGSAKASGVPTSNGTRPVVTVSDAPGQRSLLRETLFLSMLGAVVATI
ncbi:unnamed protein product [Discula destructiva]